MLARPDPVLDAAAEPVACPAADYERVRRIVAFLTERRQEQPSVEAVAAHVGLSAAHVHHLFRRWAGLSPGAFLAAITLDAAKALLADEASVLDAAFAVGLSGPGRLHDLFVTHEAMSPGEWKRGGAGLAFAYGYHSTPFGEAVVVASPRGLAGLGFVDDGDRASALLDMRRRWPNAGFSEDSSRTAPLAAQVFDPALWRAEQPLRVVMIGTDFEVRVWQTLLRIPLGRAATYAGVAAAIGQPGAARAVGAAVGRNPLSFVVPCHRVLGSGGRLTGYHWGLTRKRMMLGWEAGRVGGRSGATDPA